MPCEGLSHILGPAAMLGEQGLGNGVGVRYHTLYLRGLKACILNCKPLSFSYSQCYTWDLSISISPVSLFCISVNTHHLSPPEPTSFSREGMRELTILCTLLTQMIPFPLFFFCSSSSTSTCPVTTNSFISIWPFHTGSRVWTHVLPPPTFSAATSANNGHLGKQQQKQNLKHVLLFRIMTADTQLIKHSLYHWISINYSLALMCCWHLRIGQRCFTHFVSILRFHLYSIFQFKMFLPRSLAYWFTIKIMTGPFSKWLESFWYKLYTA